MKTTSLFETAASSHQLLKELYLTQKRQNPMFSLAYICKKARLPSKGYLGDLLSGRRRIKLEHATKLAHVFALKGLEKAIFLKLVQSEQERSPTRQEMIRKRIRALQVQIHQGNLDFPSFVSSRLLFTRVFCALGLFPEAPTQKMITCVFPEQEARMISHALIELVRSGVIEEIDGRFRVKNLDVMYGFGNDDRATAEYVAEFVEFAKDQLMKQFQNKDETFFSSSIVSVSRRRYIEQLPRIREFFDSLQTDLQVDNGADELVHFNIQIFPEALKRASIDNLHPVG